MSLREQLDADLLEAVRSKDGLRRSALRLIKASVQSEEKSRGKELGDDDVVQVLSREAKRRRESIEAFRDGNRPDLVEKEEAELALIAKYLPQQLSEDEVREIARAVIEEVGASGPGERGKVMGRLMPQVKGKADGKMVNQIVGELLAGKSG